MSEKMDGVRAYWNGTKLISRQGKIFTCPEWFIASLPADVTLDGELWMGPATMHTTVVEILNSKSGDWNQIGYYVFDIPSSRGTYEEKMAAMLTLETDLPPHVHVVKNTQ